jgi:hypothetical protein
MNKNDTIFSNFLTQNIMAEDDNPLFNLLNDGLTYAELYVACKVSAYTPLVLLSYLLSAKKAKQIDFSVESLWWSTKGLLGGINSVDITQEYLSFAFKLSIWLFDLVNWPTSCWFI